MIHNLALETNLVWANSENINLMPKLLISKIAWHKRQIQQVLFEVKISEFVPPLINRFDIIQSSAAL